MVKSKKCLSPRPAKTIHKTLLDNRSQASKISANFKVLVRVRPCSEKELSVNSRLIIKIVDKNVLIFDPKESEQAFFFHGIQQNNRDLNKRANKQIQFVFDTVFGPDTNNDDIFNFGTKSLIQAIMDGYNCSVFVYGATGAGKTHTMLGHDKCPGVTYLTMRELFDQMEALSMEREFELGITYLEVYNETVNDLLNPGEPLHLREDSKFGVCVAGITVKQITNATELFDLLKQGNANRTQHPTDANAESSRSHAVFQVYVNMKNRVTNERRIAKLSMIDLAGSERGAATGCTGMRFTEGANINKSLLALGNCINSLADGHRHVPYRDSKLTRLLKDSLGGNCQTVMIANISPTALNYEDTYNTLKYATRAKKIKSSIKKNVIKNELTIPQYIKLVDELTNKNKDLEKKLQEMESKVCNCPNESITSNYHTPCVKQPLPQIVTDTTERSTWKENLRQLFKEKESIKTQICRLEHAEQLTNLRIKFKNSIEHKLKLLCVENAQFEKGVNKIVSTVENFQRKASNIKTELKNLHDLQTRIDKDIDLLKIEDTDTSFSGELSNIDENKYLKQKLSYYEQVFDFYQLELDQRDKYSNKVTDILKQYYMMLCGYGHVTSNMKDEYNNLVQMVQGIRSVTWEDDKETPEPMEDENLKLESCKPLICIEKSTPLKAQENHTGVVKKKSIIRKLYENSHTPKRKEQEIVPPGSEKKNISGLNETFNMQICVNTPNKMCNNTKPVKKDITRCNVISAANILPKVYTKVAKKNIGPTRNFALESKENKEPSKAKISSALDKTQRLKTRKNMSILDGGVMKRNITTAKSVLLESRENRINIRKKN